MSVTASAPAKVILLGEHFVVYGEPAIACAIDLRARVKVSESSDAIYVKSLNFNLEQVFHEGIENVEGTAYRKLKPVYIAARETLKKLNVDTGLKVYVDSEIPVASGLGSSAAVAAATVKAVSTLIGEDLGLEEVRKIAIESERYVHRNPSGIDPTISTYGGMIIYSKKTGVRKLNVREKLSLIIGDTGIQRSTGEQIKLVEGIARDYPEIFNYISKAARKLVLKASSDLERGDLTSFGRLMNVNHGLLSAVGVSCLKLEELIYTARKAGALGAKLTGGGGGGCMVAIATPERKVAVAEGLRSLGVNVYTTEVTYEGVRVE